MSAAELIDRLTAIVQEQADIIREQQNLLEQFGAADNLEAQIAEAEKAQETVCHGTPLERR